MTRLCAIFAALILFAAQMAPVAAQDVISQQIGRQSANATSNQMAARIIKPVLNVNGQLTARIVAASGNGRFAAAGFEDGTVVLWDIDKGRELRRTRIDGGAAALAVSNDGATLLVGGADGAIRQVGERGTSAIATMPGLSALGIDAKGTIGVAGTASGDIATIMLANRQVATLGNLPGAVRAAAFRPVAGASIWAVTASGAVYAIEAGAIRKRAAVGDAGFAAIAAGDGVALSGGNGSTIRSTDLAGATTTQMALVKIAPRSIARLSRNALLVATREGLLIIADARQGNRLARLATTARGWAVIDDSGRYDGNSPGIAAVNWQADASAIELNAFAKRYFEPGMLTNILYGQMSDLAAVPAIEDGVAPPPSLTVTLPDENPKLSGKPYQLIVLAEDMGGGIDDIRLFHNGKLIEKGALIQTQDFAEGGRKLRALAFSLIPTPGINNFRATALSSGGVQAASERISATFSGSARRGNLHVLSIGVNRYAAPIPTLMQAAPDATAMAQAFAGGKGAFGSIFARQLIDEQATKPAILAALKAIADFSTPEDTIFLYFAGHGLSPDATSWVFLPSGADGLSIDTIRRTGLSAAEIETILIGARAQRIVLAIDACQAGAAFGAFAKQRNFYLRLLGDISRTTGLTVYAATQESSDSVELFALGHGAFTYTMLEGLKGGATAPTDKSVTAFSLADYLERMVPEITTRFEVERQDTATFRLGVDFPLAAIR